MDIAFGYKKWLSNSFSYKDLKPKDLISGVVCKFCVLSAIIPIKASVRHLDAESGEHIFVSLCTEKKIQTTNYKAIGDHLLHCN